MSRVPIINKASSTGITAAVGNPQDVKSEQLSQAILATKRELKSVPFFTGNRFEDIVVPKNGTKKIVHNLGYVPQGYLILDYKDGEDGTRWLRPSLFEFREVDVNADVGTIAANSGILASDTTPILRANAAQRQEISWAVGNTDIIAWQRPLPGDVDGTKNIVLSLWVSSGATNPATFSVYTNWDEAAVVLDTATDTAASATVHEITATILAADIPDAPSYLSLQLIPAAHATDPINLVAVRFAYTSTAGRLNRSDQDETTITFRNRAGTDATIDVWVF